jgi:predicted metal-dependent enzyme (double-stranded beta helix superfamily)
MGAREIRQVGIDEFVAGVEALENFSPDKVWEYVRSRAIQPHTLEPYIFFSPAKYTRNLIFKNDLFEVLAFCWGIGQSSTVHNHHNQHGWVMVSTGKLKVQNYRILERNPQAHTCKLEPTESCLLTAGSLAKVEIEENVHQVLNLGEWNERAVSVHIYSKPYNTCEVYQLDRGTYCDMKLYYTSLYGKLREVEVATAQS